MTVLDIFWIFFMLSALQPVIRQRMLDAMRMRKIAQLERERNSRVILLVHRVRRLWAEQAEALAEKLSAGTWTHDYPIAAEEARELGLPVSTEMPDRVLELMALYPQPVHTQPGGVEYLPIPRQKEPTPMPL